MAGQAADTATHSSLPHNEKYHAAVPGCCQAAVSSESIMSADRVFVTGTKCKCGFVNTELLPGICYEVVTSFKH